MVRMRGTQPEGTWADGEPRFADGELSQAIQDDDAAQARAMRSGDKDPGRKNTQRVAKALAEVTERLRVLDQAKAQSEQSVFVLLAKNQDDAQAAVAQARQDAERRYQESLDALQDARDGFHRAARLRTWAADPGRRFKEVIPPLNVPGMNRSNGEQITLEPVIAALQAEITPPVKPRQVSHYEQKVEKVIRGGQVSEVNFRAVPVFKDEMEPQPLLALAGCPSTVSRCSWATATATSERLAWPGGVCRRPQPGRLALRRA